MIEPLDDIKIQTHLRRLAQVNDNYIAIGSALNYYI